MDRPMTAPELTAPRGPASGHADVASREAGPPDGPLMTLRGAGVEVDARRAGRVVVGVCISALAVLAVVLFVAGADKNAQITSLRHHGVPVEVTVSGCLGLLGGSGSNQAGYACTGTYTLGGHRHQEAIPGNTFLATGAKLRGVTLPGDPALLSTVGAVATEHPSWRVFIVPTILVIIVVLLVGKLALRRRHDSRPATTLSEGLAGGGRAAPPFEQPG
jgi:hypothetical protein